MNLAFSFLILIGAGIAVDEAASKGPQMKEGLWSIHMATTINPGNRKTENTHSVCRNHEYDTYMRAHEVDKAACKVFKESVSGSTFTGQAECTVNGTIVRSNGIVVMTGDTVAHSEAHATYTPPLYGMSETQVIMDQKYTGACPAGTQPGDVIQPDGTKTNHWRH